jgi:hypothetical protein
MLTCGLLVGVAFRRPAAGVRLRGEAQVARERHLREMLGTETESYEHRKHTMLDLDPFLV